MQLQMPSLGCSILLLGHKSLAVWVKASAKQSGTLKWLSNQVSYTFIITWVPTSSMNNAMLLMYWFF